MSVSLLCLPRSMPPSLTENTKALPCHPSASRSARHCKGQTYPASPTLNRLLRLFPIITWSPGFCKAAIPHNSSGLVGLDTCPDFNRLDEALGSFYLEADNSKLWQQVEPAYRIDIDHYQSLAEQSLADLQAHLIVFVHIRSQANS